MAANISQHPLDRSDFRKFLSDSHMNASFAASMNPEKVDRNPPQPDSDNDDGVDDADDDDIDMEKLDPPTRSSRKRPLEPTPATSSAELTADEIGALKKKRKRQKREKTLAHELLIYRPPSQTACMPEMAAQCRNVNSMVRMACINLSNLDDLCIMEWSEATMLQLCIPKIELDMTLIDWSAACSILKHQWSHEVVSSLRKHRGALDPLSKILTENHTRKVNLNLVRPDEMFKVTPKINYALLRTLCIEPTNYNVPSSFINMRNRTKP